ncbi:serine O-acetyltransferase [Bifidobacterium gallicum DSM 20093 = LMG 11596]|uniref:Serine acetyltransferase n=2 Tax=Bifidobacterium gallicum TaxID=78342 RepID=D1NWV9_9BIFI|nr:serine O-acetyltransferase [Bifidobacterium gallicum DSM 20093 = LMG 11596]KFI57505.1 serine O-acetyltransferase [Bifidobacterium gallicum DSM 20093 = LMG 11596]
MHVNSNDPLGAAISVVTQGARGLSDLLGAYQKRDPAARTKLEVLLLYPGVHAVIMHRVSNWLWRHHLRFLARLNSQIARHMTGIEIHPGATIGRRFVIDHGMGIVIGETAQVGNDCLIYHGVTLGGTGKDRGKRHPTLGDHVLVGCNASVLGPVTIGNHSRVAAEAVVLHDVPPYSTVAGVPAHVVRSVNDKDEVVHSSASLRVDDEEDICLDCDTLIMHHRRVVRM